MNRYKKNCEFLAAYDPLTALRLSGASKDHLQKVESAKGVENLLWKKDNIEFFLHDEHVPEQEIKDYLASYKLADVDVIYFYGVGLGHSWPPLRAWLQRKPERSLVYLEDDLAALDFFLGTEAAEEILRHPQVQVAVFHKIEEEGSTFHALTWKHLLKQILVLALPSYKEHRKEVAELLVDRLTYESANKNQIVSEFFDHGVAYYRNLYANMKHFHRCYHGNELFGNFHKIPAVICGAGPSMNAQLDFIKELQNRALIFAGGSAINVLNGAGINPHFGGGIDPNKDQYTRYKENEAYEVPFFFRPRLQSDAFLVIDGPKLYINGAGGYDTGPWLDEKLGISAEEIDSGHNIVNFLVNVAVHLGCDPIIIVGMDLAYTKLEAYAKNVLASAAVKEQDIVETQTFETGAISRPDIYGKPTYTLWKWIAEAEWIAALAKEYSHLTFINATEGGIGFKGVENKPLKDAAELFLRHSFDFEGMVHQQIQGAAMPQVTHESVFVVMMELKASMQRAVGHLETLVEDTQNIVDRHERGESIPAEGLSGLGILAELDLKDEPAYTAVLAVFEKVKRHHLGDQIKDPQKMVEFWTFLLATAKLNLEMIEIYYEQ